MIRLYASGFFVRKISFPLNKTVKIEIVFLITLSKVAR